MAGPSDGAARVDGAARRPRLFTVDEANALLPTVRLMLNGLRAAVATLEKIRRRVPGDDDGQVERPASDSWVDPDHYRAIVTFHRALAQFQDRGIQLKDLDKGLVDFPARHGEGIILLCWQEGEAKVDWFHDLEAGFGGRQPIADLDADES